MSYRELAATMIDAYVERAAETQAVFLGLLREEMARPDLSRHALWKWRTGRAAVPVDVFLAAVALIYRAGLDPAEVVAERLMAGDARLVDFALSHIALPPAYMASLRRAQDAANSAPD